MSNISDPPLATGISPLASSYKAILCDVWGVLHNGVAAFDSSNDALVRFRASGGKVVLITNAPRRKELVVESLDRYGVSRDAYDDIVTSGDTARSYLAGRPDARAFYIGTERDKPDRAFFNGEFTGEDEAELILCTGLFNDEVETPEDYIPLFTRLVARGLPMVCLNPDLVVERGDRLVWCSGALAQQYRKQGGETTVIGKPHAAIYEKAMGIAQALCGEPLARDAVLAIGDGIDTDVRGAVGQQIDVAFITGGIHNGLFGERLSPDIKAIHAFLAEKELSARVLLPCLAW